MSVSVNTLIVMSNGELFCKNYSGFICPKYLEWGVQCFFEDLKKENGEEISPGSFPSPAVILGDTIDFAPVNTRNASHNTTNNLNCNHICTVALKEEYLRGKTFILSFVSLNSFFCEHLKAAKSSIYGIVSQNTLFPVVERRLHDGSRFQTYFCADICTIQVTDDYHFIVDGTDRGIWYFNSHIPYHVEP